MKAKDLDHVNNLVLFILASLFFLFCVSLQPRIMATEKANEWDVLIFTQNWPNSVCIKWKNKSPNSTCNAPPNKNDWTIHGIWPTKFGTLGPWFCNTSLPFNVEAIYGILNKLEDQWTRVENHKKHMAFWKHEWEKHGTCAAILDRLGTEFKYFYQGLVWNHEYNLTNILQRGGISPSNRTVKSQQVIQAIKQVLGKNPFVSCFTHPKTKAVYLLEIRLCFDKTLTLVDCDGVKVPRQQKYFNDLRFSSDFGDDMEIAHELPNANLTDCPADSNLLFPMEVPKDEVYPKLPVSPLANALRLISFIEWATL